MKRERPAYGIKPGKPPKPKRPWSSDKISQPGAPKSSKIRKMSAGGGFGFGDDTKWMSTRAENAMNYNAANAPRVAGDGSSFGAGGPMTSSTPGMVAPQAEPTAAPGVWKAGGSVYNNTASPIGVTSMKGQEGSALRNDAYAIEDGLQRRIGLADGKAASIKDGQHMWGMVEGPGGPREDKVGPARLPGSEERALLSDGEAVLPADVVQSMNRDFFSQDPDGVEKYSLINHQNPADNKDYQRRVENVGGPMALREFAGQYADGKKNRKCSGGKAILRLQDGGTEFDPLNPLKKPIADLDPNRRVDDAEKAAMGTTAPATQSMAQTVADEKIPLQDPGVAVKQLTVSQQAEETAKANAAIEASNARIAEQKAAYDKYVADQAAKKAAEESKIGILGFKDGTPLRGYAGGKPVKKLSGGAPKDSPEPGRVMKWAAERYANGPTPTAPPKGIIARTAGWAGDKLGKGLRVGAQLGGAYTYGNALMDSEAPAGERVARGVGGALMVSPNPIHQLVGTGLALAPTAANWGLEKASETFLDPKLRAAGIGGDKFAAVTQADAPQAGAPQAGAPQAGAPQIGAPSQTPEYVVPNPSILRNNTPAVVADGEVHKVEGKPNTYTGVGTPDTETVDDRLMRERLRNAIWDNSARSGEWIKKNAPRYLANQQTIQDAQQAWNNIDVARAAAQSKQLDMYREDQRNAYTDSVAQDADTQKGIEAYAKDNPKLAADMQKAYTALGPAMAKIPANRRPTYLAAAAKAQGDQAGDQALSVDSIQRMAAFEKILAANPDLPEATIWEALNTRGGVEGYLDTVGRGKQIAYNGGLYKQQSPETSAVLRQLAAELPRRAPQ